jgi:hypothetical protein
MYQEYKTSFIIKCWVTPCCIDHKNNQLNEVVGPHSQYTSMTRRLMLINQPVIEVILLV